MDAKTLVIMPEGALPDGLALPDGVEMEARRGGALAFTYHREAISPVDILDVLRNAGVRIRDVATEEADLEDVFLDLTRSAPASAAP